MGRPYTEDEIEFIRTNYGKTPARGIGRTLGRSQRSIYGKAYDLGLNNPREILGSDFLAFFRSKHALGWSDGAIARARGVCRHAVGHLRRKLGLPAIYTPWIRAQAAKRTREQLRAAGLPSLAALQKKVWRQRVKASGWPEDITWRQVQILNLLWERGPMTREQIGQSLGFKKKKRSGRALDWYPMMCNGGQCRDGGGATYLSDLMKRGLVISLGKVAGGGGRLGQYKVCVYSLPLGIERRNVNEEEKSTA